MAKQGQGCGVLESGPTAGLAEAGTHGPGDWTEHLELHTGSPGDQARNLGPTDVF